MPDQRAQPSLDELAARLAEFARERDWDMRWFQHPVRLRDRVPVPPKGPTLAAGSAAAAVGTGIALWVWLRRRTLGPS